MHRYEILNKYRRLAIGVIENEKPKLIYPQKGALSLVPHAEPTWLSKGFSSPYFDDSHRKLQKFMRSSCGEVDRSQPRRHVRGHARLCRCPGEGGASALSWRESDDRQLSGERPDPELIKHMGKDGVYINVRPRTRCRSLTSPAHASRSGPPPPRPHPARRSPRRGLHLCVLPSWRPLLTRQTCTSSSSRRSSSASPRAAMATACRAAWSSVCVRGGSAVAPLTAYSPGDELWLGEDEEGDHPAGPSRREGVQKSLNVL